MITLGQFLNVENAAGVEGSRTGMAYEIEITPHGWGFDHLVLKRNAKQSDFDRVATYARITGEVLCRLKVVEYEHDWTRGAAPAYKCCSYSAEVLDGKIIVGFQWVSNVELVTVGFDVRNMQRWLTACFEKPVKVRSHQVLKLIFYPPRFERVVREYFG